MYPDFPFMSLLFERKRYPHISDSIIAYISPYDMNRWSKATVSRQEYDETHEAKAFAIAVLPQVWSSTTRDLQKYLNIGNQDKDKEKEVAEAAKQNSEIFFTLVRQHEAALKTEFLKILSKDEKEWSAARTSAFFLSQGHDKNVGDILSIVEDDKLDDSVKAAILASQVVNGIVFYSGAQENLLPSNYRYNNCCNNTCATCDSACYMCHDDTSGIGKINWLTCWSIGFAVTSSGYCCCGISCNDKRPITWTPMLASALYAGIHTTEVVRDIYPGEIPAALQAIERIKSTSYYCYYAHPSKPSVKLSWDTNSVHKADRILLSLKLNFSEEEINKNFQHLRQELAQLSDAKSCLALYERESKASWLNQKPPSNWLDTICLFARANSYATVKINFIVLCQEKLMAYCTQKQGELAPKDFLEFCQMLKLHEVFNEKHCELGVDRQCLDRLKKIIKNVENYLATTNVGIPCTEKTPLLANTMQRL